MNTSCTAHASSSLSNKTILCLISITLFSTFFFVRSIQLREPWIVPTFLSHSPLQNGTYQHLLFVNDWLKNGALNRHFSNYMLPESVENPTLDKRAFFASYPPGSTILVYLPFKLLDATSIVPNIYEKRGTQLLLLVLTKYLLHYFLTIILCLIVFILCSKIGFDYLNSMLLAIIPAIVQFHNANSLWYHHLPYYHDIVVMLPFALYIFLNCYV